MRRRRSIRLKGAAQMASAQMRVQSLADSRPDRVVWEGRQWEWAGLRPEYGTFDADSYVDLEAREKWFYQAQIESPAMFARAPRRLAVLALSARRHRRVSRRRPDLPAQRATTGARQAVLVDHRLRRRDANRNRHRSAPGCASIPGRTLPRSPRGGQARRALLRPRAGRGHRGSLDMNHPRQG